DLDADTLYQFAIRKKCGEDDYSVWITTLIYIGEGIINIGDHPFELLGLKYAPDYSVIDLLSDYSVSIGEPSSLQVINLQVNGAAINGPNTTFNSINEFLTWVNGLNIGTFIFEDGVIKTLGNKNLLSQISFKVENDNYTLTIPFEQRNLRL